MPLPKDHKSAADEILQLIEDSELPLTEIARSAGVKYQPFWKWVTGRKKEYSILDGELVYYYLTGRTFLS